MAPPSKGKTPLEARLEKSCVSPGGTQTLFVTTSPKAPTVFDSYYSDGKSGINEGFYGGNDGAKADDAGTASFSWPIAPHAPTGPVRILVKALEFDHDVAEVNLTYTLAPPTGCPSS